jgi:hypothetical protein
LRIETAGCTEAIHGCRLNYVSLETYPVLDVYVPYTCSTYLYYSDGTSVEKPATHETALETPPLEGSKWAVSEVSGLLNAGN